MPYIEQGERKAYDNVIENLLSVYISKGAKIGDLNYIVSRMLKRICDKNLNYAKANELMGVLSCIQAEFYRRIVTPYEEKKIKENGDVY